MIEDEYNPLVVEAAKVISEWDGSEWSDYAEWYQEQTLEAVKLLHTRGMLHESSALVPSVDVREELVKALDYLTGSKLAGVSGRVMAAIALLWQLRSRLAAEESI